MRALLLSLSVCLAFCSQVRERIATVQSDEAFKHRLTAKAIIHRKMPPGYTSLQAWLHVVVNSFGQVESAEVWNLPNQDDKWARAEAEEAEKQQQFDPFRRLGRAIRVTFDDDVWIVPPVEWAETHKEFPEIKNRNSLRMAIQRGACYGTCPAYSLEVRGNGDVFFTGQSGVPARGHFHTRVSQQRVEQLLASFRKADYLGLKDEYRAMITDNPTCITSLQFDTLRKSVTDYVGFAAGMPEAVWQVERDLDQIARKQGWIR